MGRRCDLRRRYTGDLQHCSIEATYNSGITLTFGLLSDFTLLIVLTNPVWSLRDEVKFPLQLAVDRRWSKSVSGTALAPSSVFVSLGGDWEAFEALRMGRELRVTAARETFEFLLTGTSVSLAEAARCVLQSTQVASRPDPFSVQSDPFGSGATVRSQNSAGSSPTDGTSRSEIAGFLAAAGLEKAVLLSDVQLAQSLPYAHHGWTIGNTVGAFAEYALDGRTLQQVLAAEIAAISERCEGQVLSGSQPPKPTGEITMGRFALTCTTVDETLVINGILVHGDASVVLIEHLGAAAFTDEIKRADDLVAATIEAVYRGD
jgi:hypothetical protein